VEHIWALCGDYIGDFMDEVIREGSVQLHYPATEQEGGYAANGYALTTKKPGLIAATYGVGSFNTLNAITTGWVALNPMIMLNGAPSQKQFQSQRHQGILYHHMMEQGKFDQKNIFKHVTTEAAIISNPEVAVTQIDNALQSCITYNLPVYLEFESSVFKQLVSPPKFGLKPGLLKSDVDQLNAAVNYTVELLKKSKKPIIWQGAEIHRYNAEPEFMEFLDKTKIPYLSSIDGKGVISEFNPLFQGVFAGAFTEPEIIELVKNADCFLQLGIWYSDISLGKQTLYDFFKENRGYINANRMSITGQDGKIFNVVNIKEFLHLLNLKLGTQLDHCSWSKEGIHGWPHKKFDEKWDKPTKIDPNTKLSYDIFFQAFKDYLLGNAKDIPRDQVVLMYDASLSLFSGIQIPVGMGNAFSELSWGSIGWSSGASIGVAIANRKKRVFVFVGDGGFQNCSTGPSSAVREKLNPIYFVFQNNTYAIDQYLINPNDIRNDAYPEYNRLPNWDYAKLMDSYGGSGFHAFTVKDLSHALDDAIKLTDKPALITVHIPPTDIPSVLNK